MRNYTEQQTVEAKAQWTHGLWTAEPDIASWNDDETGYACRITRDPVTGCLSGAVGVTSDHPAYKTEVDASPVHFPTQHVDAADKDGKWWFAFFFDGPLDGAPGTNHNIDAYQPFRLVGEHVTKVARELGAYAAQQDGGRNAKPAAEQLAAEGIGVDSRGDD